MRLKLWPPFLWVLLKPFSEQFQALPVQLGYQVSGRSPNVCSRSLECLEVLSVTRAVPLDHRHQFPSHEVARRCYVQPIVSA